MVSEQIRSAHDRPPTDAGLSRRRFVVGAFGVGLTAVAAPALTGCGNEASRTGSARSTIRRPYVVDRRAPNGPT